jgi:hypothetical protein
MARLVRAIQFKGTKLGGPYAPFGLAGHDGVYGASNS